MLIVTVAVLAFLLFNDDDKNKEPENDILAAQTELNNAQATIQGLIEDISEEAIELTFGSGFLGTLYHMQAAFPYLKQRGGSVINFGTRQTDRLAGFSHDELREALLLLDERGGNVFEDFAALPARQGTRAAQTGHGVAYGLARVGTCGNGDAANKALIPRRAHFQRFAIRPLFTAQQKSGLRTRAHLHQAAPITRDSPSMVKRGGGESISGAKTASGIRLARLPLAWHKLAQGKARKKHACPENRISITHIADHGVIHQRIKRKDRQEI